MAGRIDETLQQQARSAARHEPRSAATRVCATCGTSIDATAASCPVCGVSLVVGGDGSRYLPTGTLLQHGNYRLEKVLGSGGFGITYRGHDINLDRPVAIKEFFPAECGREGQFVMPAPQMTLADLEAGKRRFIEEGRAVARFDHSGIVDAYACFEENNTAYMVMELLDGVTLGEIIRQKNGRFEVKEALDHMVPVGEALHAVHKAGMLHCDIKPDNIMCSGARRVLIDFGAKEHITAGPQGAPPPLATPGYGALEQYSAAADRGPYTDVYAVAATFYHLFTGQAPPTATERARGVVLPNLEVLAPQLKPAMVRAIIAGLELNIFNRPQNIGQFFRIFKGEETWRPRSDVVRDFLFPADASPAIAAQPTPDAVPTYVSPAPQPAKAVPTPVPTASQVAVQNAINAQRQVAQQVAQQAVQKFLIWLVVTCLGGVGFFALLNFLVQLIR